MKKKRKISLLTFNFNEYDIIRTHFISPNIEYIYVTDGDEDIENFNCKRIKNNNSPWYNSLYVRYHPFEFVDTDYVIVIDSSLSSNKNLEILADKFIDSNYDLCVMLSHEPILMRRIDEWKNRNRIDNNEALALKEMVNKYVGKNFMGVTAGAVRLYKKSNKTMDYLKTCWDLVNLRDVPFRLDEIPSSIALSLVKDLTIMATSLDLIDGDVFKLYYHKNNKRHKFRFDRKFWLMNKIVEPALIGEQYERVYDYKTEAMCLTRYFTETEFKDWIEHHLSIGFDHIHIFDNGCNFKCKEVCGSYNGRVSYEFIEGKARHYKIFNDYVNSERCKSEWIIPIDDDEYLSLNKSLVSNMNELLEWFKSKFPDSHMFAIRWKHLFPKKFHSDPDGSILEYCTEENPELASKFQRIGDRGIKTLVHRYGNIYYEEAEENPSGGHVPKHNLSRGARLFNNEMIKCCACNQIPNDENEPARLIHCRYKGYTAYKSKNKDIRENNLCLDNTSGLVYTRNYKFDDILEIID